MPENPLAKHLPKTGNPLEKHLPKESNPLAKHIPQGGSAGQVINKIKEHPFRAIFSPAAETLTGKSLQERAIEATKPTEITPGDPLAFAGAVAKQTLGGIGGELADIATTPFSLVAGPVAKGVGKVGALAGKLPLAGTTLGKIVSKVPISQVLNKDVASIVKYQEALKGMSTRIAESRAPLREIRRIVDPIERVTQAIKKAGPARKLQEKLFTEERAKRAQVIERIGKGQKGEAGFISQLKALKGKLPKAQFEGIRGKINQTDIDSLYNTIDKTEALSAFEKITTKRGLSKLFGETGGSVPTRGELDFLRKVFPEDFIKTVAEKRPFLQKFGETVGEVLNLPRSMMSSFDLSAPLRQGVFLVGRPKQWLPAFGNMFKFFFNEKSYKGLIDDIKARPTYDLMKQSKLALTDINAKLAGREEAFMSGLAEKIPLFGKGVRASNRAFGGFLNKLRADVFDDIVGKAKQQKIPMSAKATEDIAKFINAATGRGNLPAALERAAVALNATFFSPKLISSRLSLMDPSFYIRLDPIARKEALKSLLTFSGLASSVLMLAKAGGAEVNLDPRNSDFAKIRVGNTRYDILGGFQQFMRLAAQMVTGERVSSTTGVVTTSGEGFKPLTRKQILGRFIETKEAPVLSFVSRMLEGKGFAGEELNVPEEVSTRFIPMVAQDMFDLQQERGAEGVGMALPAFFGVGVQTYAASPSETVHSAEAAIRFSKELFRNGDEQKAQEMIDNNRDLIDLATKLSGSQKALNKLEKVRDRISDSKRFSDAEKISRKEDIDLAIKQVETRMEDIVAQDKLIKGRGPSR